MYRNHLESHGKDSENLHGCNICGKSFSVPARLTRHYRTHTGEKPYQCEYCKKSFSVKENLSVHRRIHTKERPYKCDVCDSAFEHSGKLHRHMRIHTGERPHKCSVCNKMFIQSGQLVIHMRTHTGEKPYTCKTCGKGFTCSKQLKVHSRTHTGEKPYKCDICYKSFGYNHVLKLHQVSHYGEKCYKCSICHETFNSKKLIEYHIKTHSNSFFCNSTKSTESIFKTQNINNILLYNSNVGTNDMNMLIIENKNDNEIANIAETIIKLENKSTNGSLNYFLCDSLHYQHHTNKNSKKVSQVITDQAYLTVNKNILFSKNLNTSNMEVEYPLEIEDRRQISIQQGLHSYADSNNCFTYKIYDDEYVSNAHFSNFCLASGCLRRNINTNSLIQDAQCTQSSKAANTLELNIPYVKDNVRLPPRKRCKMILELMESKKPELTDPTICNTVIKFAKADNVNMSNG